MVENWNFEVEYSEYSLEFLEKADKNLRKRIFNKINYLAKNFDKINHIPLAYEARDFFKLRVGKYRIIYRLDWKRKKIRIDLIDRRDKIYKILRNLI
jgi:mRNA interferase RelE/StbE